MLWTGDRESARNRCRIDEDDAGTCDRDADPGDPADTQRGEGDVGAAAD